MCWNHCPVRDITDGPTYAQVSCPMPALNFDFPYNSQRMPVMADNVVATSNPLAVQSGLHILRQGGNALDAALATAITLTVVEPNNNGLGSDAFAIVWDGGSLTGLNASGRSPRALTLDHFRRHDSVPATGWLPVTVPGAVSAWIALSERFGRLPFEQLFDDAVRYARKGYAVPPITAQRWGEAEEYYSGCPDFARTFCPGGHAPRPFDTVCMPDHASTLEQIRDSRGDAFYRGDIAGKIAAYAHETGGLLTEEDMAEHRADWTKLLSMDFAGHTLHEIPPNGQGIAALIACGILRHAGVDRYAVDSADSLHMQIEAMKLAFADVYRYVADPAYMDVAPEELLYEGYLADRARLIDMDVAGDPGYGIPPKGGTVYLTTADSSGMMVSYIQSNFMGFGSGVVVPGTGIAMQNRGFGFSLDPDHPNCAGGGKRPYHTIIPAFVTRGGEPVMSFGVMGGPMQPQGHLQMMVRVFIHGQNPQTAADAPRWRVMGDRKVIVEDGVNATVLDELTGRGHLIERADSSQFGGAQLIYREGSRYCAGSDPRKDGQAAGY